MPPLISERQKKTSPLVSHAKENQVAAAVRSGVQKKDPSLFISEKHTLASTLTAKPQDAASVKDSLTYHEVSSDDLGTVTEEFQQISDSSIGKIPASESQKKIYTAFIPEHNKIPIPVLSVSDEMVQYYLSFYIHTNYFGLNCELIHSGHLNSPTDLKIINEMAEVYIRYQSFLSMQLMRDLMPLQSHCCTLSIIIHK